MNHVLIRDRQKYKATEWFQCKRKVAHGDWWSAYLHLKRLQRLNPYREVGIYACNYCEYLHVGSPTSLRKVRRVVKKYRRMINHIGFKEHAPADVQANILSKLYKLERALQYEA